MTLYFWSKFTFLLFCIPVLVGGIPGVSKEIGSPRNYLYFSLLILLISFIKKNNRSTLISLIKGIHPDISKESYNKWSTLILFLGSIAYLKVAVINTLSFKLIDVDFSYFDLMISNFMRGKGWYSDACQCNHMGVHSTYLFYVFAPIHKLFNSPFVLQIIHALGLSLTLIPLRKILESFKIRRDFSLAFLFAFISYSPFVIILDYNFHFEVFFIPFFLSMLYFYREKLWGWVHVFAILSLLVKEDAGFYLLGFFAAIVVERRNIKQAFILLIYTLPLTYISLKVFIPAFRETTDYVLAGTASLYGKNISDVLVNMAKDPVGVGKYVILGKWWKFLLPFFGLPLLQWGFLLSVAPFVLIHSTAFSPTMRNLMLYYVAPFLPFIIFYFFKALSQIKRDKLKNGITIFSIIYIAIVGGGRIRIEPLSMDLLKYKSHIKNLDLVDKKICAQGSILPQLGYESRFTSLPKCSWDEKYDFIFIGQGINPYPFSHEVISSKIVELKKNYKIDKKIGELYVFKPKDI